MGGARVGRSAVIRDSIIGAGAIVGDGAVIEALSILGDGQAVAAGVAASGQLFPASVP
jgi:NDP-sugar pyrophosphorylase family protein